MLQDASIKATAQLCDVAPSTAFCWRHRFLTLLSQAKPEALVGIVETDEMCFLESHKGKRGLENPRKRD